MLVDSYSRQPELKSLVRQETPEPVGKPDTTNTPAYPYRELVGTDIRFLRILAGKGHDRIECCLEQVPLTTGSRPIFYALSYVWGDVSEKRDILLEGQPFQVTKNLHEALQQIREMPGSPADFGYPEDYIWVDAICINQDDIDERSQQVPRMMEIYQSSLVVIIWLGPNKPSTDNTLKRSVQKGVPHGHQFSPSVDAGKLCNTPEPSTDGAIKELFHKASTLWVDWELSDDGSNDSVILHDVFGPSWDAMVMTTIGLLQRPWFTKVWTIQEACLGTNTRVLSGGQSIQFEELIVFLKAMMPHNRLLSLTQGMRRIVAFDEIKKLYHRVTASELRGERLKMETAEAFVRLLGVMGHKLSTDPRDQIYGLLGLVKWFAEEDLPAELTPDYGLPIERIYWQYASYFLRSTGNLRLLGSRLSELRDVPSWVPDFRHYHSHYERECQTPTPISISSDLRILHLQGILIGHAHDYISICDPGVPSPTFDLIPTGIPIRIQAVEQRIVEPSAFIREISSSQILDDFLDGLYRNAGEGGIALVRQVYCRLRKPSHGKRTRCAKRKSTPDSLWIERLVATEFSNPFVLLSDGTILRLNRYDVEIRPGDIACLFRGAANPSILRPCGEGYVFLGQCHIISSRLDDNTLDDEFWDNRMVREFKLV